MVDVLIRLEAIEDIRFLKARYFRLLDEKNWAEFAALFTGDAVMDISEVLPAGTPSAATLLTGPDAIVRQIGGVLGDAIMIHNGYTHEITIESAEAATAIWSMEDHAIFPEGVPSPFPFRRAHNFGRYHERYEKSGGQWRIAALKLTRHYMEVS